MSNINRYIYLQDVIEIIETLVLKGFINFKKLYQVWNNEKRGEFQLFQLHLVERSKNEKSCKYVMWMAGGGIGSPHARARSEALTNCWLCHHTAHCDCSLTLLMTHLTLATYVQALAIARYDLKNAVFKLPSLYRDNILSCALDSL